MKVRVAVPVLLALCLMAWAADDAVTAPQATVNLQSGICNLKSVEAVALPPVVSYQGRLTDAKGEPIADGQHAIRFRLYAEPTDGTHFWEETQQVTTRDGMFSVLLGAVKSITTGDGRPATGAAYLGMAVEGDAEMTPRLRIAGSTSAYLSDPGADSRSPRLGTDADDAWVRIGSDSVLYTIRRHGIVRGGSSNVLYGTYGYTQTIFGSSCTTGASGANVGNIAIGGGYGNRAWAPFTAVCGGRNNKAGDAATDTSAIVVGGYGNRATEKFSAVIAGQNNTASGIYSTVAGGYRNTASALGTCVGGGENNTASVDHAAVAGGIRNLASHYNAFVGAGYDDTASGNSAVVCGGGVNRASGSYSVVGGGNANSTSGDYATVGGGYADTALAYNGGVLSGRHNLAGDAATDTGACVAGGVHNEATGMWSFVGGGRNNTASGYAYTTVSGGAYNAATVSSATVAGGAFNNATDYYATVAGGGYNDAGGQQATVGGGCANRAYGYGSTVAGGDTNFAAVQAATVGGGYADTALALFGGVFSGFHNVAGDEYGDDSGAVVAGGGSNRAIGDWSYVGGGRSNTALEGCAVGGGSDNSASGDAYATVGGGSGNTAEGVSSTVGGGSDNSAWDYGAVGGGLRNAAGGFGATVGGGGDNAASGRNSTIPGGSNNAARGNVSLAAGRYACANHRGSFVWSDSSVAASESLYTTTPDQFRVRARSGTWFFSNAAMSKGVLLAPGGNTWTSVGWDGNDGDARPVDRKMLLDRLAALPVAEYESKAAGGALSIGPSGRDFHAAFGYGTENGISTGDADGVALAAIQALYEQNQQLFNQNQTLSKRVTELEAKLERR